MRFLFALALCGAIAPVAGAAKPRAPRPARPRPVFAVAIRPGSVNAGEKPSGPVVASAAGREIRLWDGASGAIVRRLLLGTEVQSLAFSADGKLLAAGGEGQIGVWTTDNETPRLLKGGAGRIMGLAFSPDAATLGAASGLAAQSGGVSLWEVATGTLQASLTGHSDVVYGLAFSPDGKWLLTGAADRTARIWDLSDRKTAKTLMGHTHQVLAVAWSADGKRAATAGGEGAVKLWDIESGETVRTLAAHPKQAWSVLFAPDGKSVYTGGQEALVRRWNSETGDYTQGFDGITGQALSLALSPDGAFLAVGSWDGSTRLFKSDSSELVRQWPEPKG